MKGMMMDDLSVWMTKIVDAGVATYGSDVPAVIKAASVLRARIETHASTGDLEERATRPWKPGEWVTLPDVEAVSSTEKALCVFIPTADRSFFIPRSWISEQSVVKESGDRGTFTLRHWGALAKGLVTERA